MFDLIEGHAASDVSLAVTHVNRAPAKMHDELNENNVRIPATIETEARHRPQVCAIVVIQNQESEKKA